jgi:hypothetical protein
MQEHKFAVDNAGRLVRKKGDEPGWLNQGCPFCHEDANCGDWCSFFRVFPPSTGEIDLPERYLLRAELYCAHCTVIIPLESAYEELK